ncbi:DUF6142 family protein [Anaerosacchariphilus polymeriproducens]|uniref:Uncharacterized protein n=1 Tax=Anaerosacchariphilus polymeriproducens TaxID=1812858 RepID=A0A371AUY4_9FIRM|nr:DUF6142 family protein [Anaerosacchariphilus polymeriproducens]RDU23386.1 hypothetical protein DWV06_10045 [Anaerosacchariphilus polymeriproducens]
MARKQKRRRKVKFGNRKHSIRGILSTIMAVFSLIIFCILIIVSYKMKGNGGIYLGTIGIAALFINIVGIMAGINSFKERERNYLYSKIGLVVNVILLITWGIIYALGM